MMQFDLFAPAAPTTAPPVASACYLHDRRLANALTNGDLVLHKIGRTWTALGSHAGPIGDALGLTIDTLDGIPACTFVDDELEQRAEQLRRAWLWVVLAEPAGERQWTLRCIRPEYHHWLAWREEHPTPDPVKIRERRLVWGKLKNETGYPSFKGAGFVLDIRETDQGVQWSEHYSWADGCGGGGPFSGPIADVTAEDVIQVRLRSRIRGCAGLLARSYTDDRRLAEVRKLAAWCIEQLSPLFFPTADAQALFDATLCSEQEKESRRCAMLKATGDVERKLWDAAKEGDFWGYPNLIQAKSESAADWRDSFKGHFYVSGHHPGKVEVVIYAYGNEATVDIHPMLEEARIAFAGAVDVPVRLATPEEYQLCDSDRGKVTW